MTATLTPREVADLRKRTCSRCLRGHHELCTTPATCAHHLCDDDGALDNDDGNPIKRSPSALHSPTPPPTPQPHEEPAMPAEPTTTLVWEEPPTRGRRPIEKLLDADGTLDQLRANPQRWARISRYDSNSGANAAAKKLRGALGGEFEWSAARDPDAEKGSVLHGRYVGEGTPAK